jgi:hypothetical protein
MLAILVAFDAFMQQQVWMGKKVGTLQPNVCTRDATRTHQTIMHAARTCHICFSQAHACADHILPNGTLFMKAIILDTIRNQARMPVAR